MKVILAEDNTFKRKIKEAVEIKTRHPYLYCDGGLELPNSCDEISCHVITLRSRDCYVTMHLSYFIFGKFQFFIFLFSMFCLLSKKFLVT